MSLNVWAVKQQLEDLLDYEYEEILDYVVQ